MSAFDVDRLWSEGIATSSGDIRAILLAELPGAQDVEPAAKSDDQDGTDQWVRMANHSISVDVKARRVDFLAHGKDDLALETWSVVEDSIVGWTRNGEKRTDMILWYWADSRRFCLVPFRPLCRVFQIYWQMWSQQYAPLCRQITTRRNGSIYHSECVFVPRSVVRVTLDRSLGLTGRRLATRL